jgi:group II intron reverse transcriptase/maturase
MQETFDFLYERSTNNATRNIDLLGIITSTNNITLAYRSIKTNKGSTTSGSDGQTIDDLKGINIETLITEIRNRLNHFQPIPIRRIEILKDNEKTRPLGISTIIDRIIGQMFLQVLTPICEAKFYKHSYGFRENRSTHHAMARCYQLINLVKCHYVVDVDIKGFFDNVNHQKLLSQLYTIGVKDRRVLAIIGKMLKANIVGIGIPSKGTPQGGILSPLLSNVVLNNLDQWVASQWTDFPSIYPYKRDSFKRGALRKSSKLKEMFIVRYADDFKIFTKDYKQAWKIFHAVKGYLENHLKLEISPEKSQVTNLRKRTSEFLGFELSVIQKQKRYVARSNISTKSKQRIKEKIREHLKRIQKFPTRDNVSKYNSYILGIHNYYSIATYANIDFSIIAYSLMYTRYNRLKLVGKYGKPNRPPPSYTRYYKNNYRTFKVADTYIYPIEDTKWKFPYLFSQTLCNYTKNGREKFGKLKPSITTEMRKLLNNQTSHTSIEYADNRLSRYSMQNGKCSVTGFFLEADTVHCHHILPKQLGGDDTFNNLVVVHVWIHRLIHATDKQTIDKYLKLLKLNKKQLEKLNKYRKKCNLTLIN